MFPFFNDEVSSKQTPEADYFTNSKFGSASSLIIRSALFEISCDLLANTLILRHTFRGNVTTIGADKTSAGFSYVVAYYDAH